MKAKILIIIILIIFIISVFLGTAGFVLWTKTGSRMMVRFLLSQHFNSQNVSWESFDGTIIQGISLKNAELRDIKKFPVGTILKIQKFYVKLNDFNFKNIYIEIENARLRLSDSEPIVVSGILKKQTLDMNVYSRGFTINELTEYLPDLKHLIPLKGEVKEIDLYIKDHYLEPRISGDMKISNFQYQGFVLTDSPWSLDLRLKGIQKDIQIQLLGTVIIHEGTLQSKKVSIKQIKGNIKFAGKWNEPHFHFSANATVEKTKIKIGLKGTLENPELALTSEPSYSKQKLMIMLATGKSWKSVEDTIDTGVLSSDLTKDFIDYFFFAGKANKIAEKFGLHDMSVTFDKDTRGIEAKKNISEKLEVGYSVQKQANGTQAPITTQKLQGEYKVNNNISIGVERELKKTNVVDDINAATEKTENDKVYLKYKKEF